MKLVGHRRLFLFPGTVLLCYKKSKETDMKGSRDMVKSQIKGAALHTVTGGAVGGTTYVGTFASGEHFNIPLDQLQIYAAIFAAIMTGLYFFAQFTVTCLKAWWEYKERRGG